MTADSFWDESDLRLRHADQRLALIESELPGPFLVDADLLVGQFDPHRSQYLIRFVGEQPRRELGLLVGEVLHAIRASLESLVWGISSRSEVPVTALYFPMAENDTPKNRKKITDATEHMTPEQRAIVEAYQPFTWSEKAASHPLAMLRHYSDVDKHRLLIPALISRAPLTDDGAGIRYDSHFDVPPHGGWRINFPSPRSWHDCDLVSFDFFDPDDRAVVFTAVVRQTGPEPVVKMNPGLVLQPVFGEVHRPLSVERLREIHRVASDIRASLQNLD